MSTSKTDVEAERARAIAEALKASGARSLTELLDDHERHKEHRDRLCAKLEALPKVIKKKTRQSFDTGTSASGRRCASLPLWGL